jgi:GNAT superfamily N-acetyltransferase
MLPFDFTNLEEIEYKAYADLYRAAPEDVRIAHDIETFNVGATTCLSCRGFEPAMIFRRALRLGVGQAAKEPELDDVISQMQSRSLNYTIPIAPQSQPPALAAWLEDRGFTQDYAWMKFARRCVDAPHVECDLEVRVIGADFGTGFGRITTEVFELAPSAAPWIAKLPGRANWICVMAFAGARPVATGALYVDGEYAWLGLGGTLPSHRRHGAQGALLAKRLIEAESHGVRIAVTETGEQLANKPSNSYRNILRAGFEERYLRQNYLSPPAPRVTAPPETTRRQLDC